MSELRPWDKNEIQKDHERLQAIVREKRRKKEARRRAEDIRLRNWTRGRSENKSSKCSCS